MKFILGILLLLGFIESILSLQKEESNHKKGLAILYIAIFAIGLIAMIIQENESTELFTDIDKISNSVNEIDSISKVTLDNFETTNSKTEEVINEIDSLHARLTSIIKRDQKLVIQYNKLNSQLESQIKYNEILLTAEAPILTVTSNDITWKESGNQSYCRICFRNTGGRPLNFIKINGVVQLVQKDGNKIDVQINPLVGEQLLPPASTGGVLHCRNSRVFEIQRDSIEAKLSKAKFTIETQYQDLALDELKSEQILRGWNQELKFHNLTTVKVKANK